MTFFRSIADLSQEHILKQLRIYLRARPYGEGRGALNWIENLQTIFNQGHCNGFTNDILYALWLEENAEKQVDLYGNELPCDDWSWLRENLISIASWKEDSFQDIDWDELKRLTLLAPSFYVSDPDYQLMMDIIQKSNELNTGSISLKTYKHVLAIITLGMKGLILKDQHRHDIKEFVEQLTSCLQQINLTQPEKKRMESLLAHITKVNTEVMLTDDDKDAINVLYDQVVKLKKQTFNVQIDNDEDKLLKVMDYFAGIERFMSSIEYFQNIHEYEHLSQGQVGQVLGNLIQFPEKKMGKSPDNTSSKKKPKQEFTLAGCFNADSLAKEYALQDQKKATLLEILTQPNRIVHIYSHDHVIGIFRSKKGQYRLFFYDSNEKTGPISYHDVEKKDLIKKIFSVMDYNSNHYSPLAFVVTSFDEQPAVYPDRGLLLQDAKMQPSDSEVTEGFSALHMAAKVGCLTCMTHWLNLGLNPNVETFKGETPLYSAAADGLLEAVKLLLALKNINPNQSTKAGMSPLYLACQNGHLSVVKEMLDPKYHINIEQSLNGATPLFVAVQFGRTEIVQELLNYQANVNASIVTSAEVLIDFAKSFDRDAEVTSLLQGMEEISEFSILHAAVFFGHKNLVELLIAKGADFKKTASGISALEMAKAMHHEDIITLLEKNLTPKIYS